MKYYLVGCGGIGGWLALALAKTLTAEDELVLIDGDELEMKNLDRQLFDESNVGMSKVEAMGEQLENRTKAKITQIPRYIGQGRPLEFAPNSWVLTGVDNHPARVKVLAMCDKAQCPCITAANGYEDAEAFFYLPLWSGSNLDPRVYYPEIMTDGEGDPLSPPCTGEILESAPQLAIANMSAASYAMWLLWFWREKADKIESKEAQEKAPVQVISTAGRKRILMIEDFKS